MKNLNWIQMEPTMEFGGSIPLEILENYMVYSLIFLKKTTLTIHVLKLDAGEKMPCLLDMLIFWCAVVVLKNFLSSKPPPALSTFSVGTRPVTAWGSLITACLTVLAWFIYLFVYSELNSAFLTETQNGLHSSHAKREFLRSNCTMRAWMVCLHSVILIINAGFSSSIWQF